MASKAGEIGLNLYDLKVDSLHVNEQEAKFSINRWWERQRGAAAQPSEEASAYKKALVNECSPPELTIQARPNASNCPLQHILKTTQHSLAYNVIPCRSRTCYSEPQRSPGNAN